MSKFRCWIPEYGQGREDGLDVDAFDAAHAAVLSMKIYEARSAEYPVASGGTAIVAVSTDDGEPEMYTVWGEARPSYHARRASHAD